MNRSGVALIIAISVLAALLFLALPFLFSQSASLAGARAAAWDGTARRGADRAAGLATALSVYATGLHRSPSLAIQMVTPPLAYVQLPQQIELSGPLHYPSFADNSWRTIISTGEDWTTPANVLITPKLDGKDVVHGGLIEDESRRIDPNILDEYGWSVVLRRAGIQDPWTVAMSWDPPASSGVWVGAPRYHWSMVSYGRLARALTYWRPGNTGRRLNQLVDLLGADPEDKPPSAHFKLGEVPFYELSRYDQPSDSYPVRGRSGWPVAEATVEGTRDAAELDVTIKTADQLGYRVAALTQAELERLRPLLSFLVPGQGRSGMIDLGTVVDANFANGFSSIVTDELSPSVQGMGASLVGSRTWTHSSTTASRDYSSTYVPGVALAIDAVPALNLNTVPSSSGMTRLYIGQPSTESDGNYRTRIEGDPLLHPEGLMWRINPVDYPTETIGHIPLLRWLDPRTGDGIATFERPPVGIAGFGIVAIEGIATARDPQGRAVGSRRRRTVVQAVPQERPIEVAWTTQGTYEALVRGRHGSWVQAGPHPTRRVDNWGSDATNGKDDMLALDGPGWLEPAPVCSFSRNPAIVFDWRVPFGLIKALPWASVLNEVDTSGNAGNPPVVAPAALRSSGTTIGALTAQGLHLTTPDALAYTVTNAVGPLRFASASGGQNDEMIARHVSLRFCLPAVPGNPVTILEARNQTNGADNSTPADGTPDAATDQQNLWRVEYRPTTERLVLIIANAALPWTDGDRARFGVAAWTSDADLPSDLADKRCLPAGSGLSFAPADPATRVEFHYAVPGGLKQSQWYHLQVICASDRPGLHGLILDGIVGRDATRPGVDMARLGDHYTWPSLRIDGDIAMTVPATAGASALLFPGSLSVTYPVDRALSAILPPRGLIRVDDEYLSYTGISGTAGTGTLTGVQRARRVNTDQASTKQVAQLPLPTPPTPPVMIAVNDDDRRWPITQQHMAGAIATPGWSQVSSVTGRWLRGSATLPQPFAKQALKGTVSTASWPAGNPGFLRFPQAPSTVSVSGSPGPWPARGYVQFHWGATSSAMVAYDGGPGTILALHWDTLPPPEIANTIASMEAVLVSMEVTGEVLDTAAKLLWNTSQSLGCVQLVDPLDGRCEWIRVNDRADRSGQTPDGRYLLHVGTASGTPSTWHQGGWDMTAYPSADEPLDQPRGSMRTPYRSTIDWPIDTVVLPVQSGIFDLDRLESGDVVTLVPRDIESGGIRRDPIQIVVRHAARDGFPAAVAASGSQWATKNEWFALTHAVPDSLLDPDYPAPTVPQAALIGRGWAGDDLSMIGNSPSRRGALPRRILLASANGALPAARCFIGSSDPRTATTQDVLIDDLCASSLRGGDDANAGASGASTQGCEITSINGSTSGSLDATAAALPALVQASQSVFSPASSGSMYGLCQIDGEVFAYRCLNGSTTAQLIARGLLGSVPAVHSLAQQIPLVTTAPTGAPTRPVAPTLPVVALPIGPVAELCSPLAANAHAQGIDVVEIPFGDYYKDPVTFGNPWQGSNANDPQSIMRSPFIVIHDPTDGTRAEVLRLLDRPASNQRITASWLRGLYGTDAVSWSAPYVPVAHAAIWLDNPPAAAPIQAQPAGSPLNPIVIGWWPRFAPGMHSSPTAEELRSRSFAWAGFPLRLSGSRFDPGIPALAAGGVADVTIADNAGTSLTVLALAAKDPAITTDPPLLFDWDQAYAHPKTLTASMNAITEPFNWDRFQNREVDGAEMRVTWDATGSGPTPLTTASDAQGRAPRLGAVRLRCVAPTRILAVEEVR